MPRECWQVGLTNHLKGMALSLHRCLVSMHIECLKIMIGIDGSPSLYNFCNIWHNRRPGPRPFDRSSVTPRDPEMAWPTQQRFSASLATRTFSHLWTKTVFPQFADCCPTVYVSLFTCCLYWLVRVHFIPVIDSQIINFRSLATCTVSQKK